MKKLVSFFGDPNIGLYGKASDKVVLLGKFLEGSIEPFFDVETVFMTISNTNFLGLFTSFNSHGIVVPFIVREKEIELLRKRFDNNVLVLKTRHTAVGNLILANDKGCVVSKLFTKEDLKKIEDVLDVECEYSTIANSNVVGSAGIATNKGCLLHRDVGEDEANLISSLLKVPVDVGTVNFGSPFVASGLIVNSKHGWIGEATTGPELDRIIRIFKI